MAKPNNKKFVWLIKNFSSLPSDTLYSASVLISDVKWRLQIHPKGHRGNFGLYFNVADASSLPSGWRRYAKFHLTIANLVSDKRSVHKEASKWFDKGTPAWGSREMLPLTELHEKDGGFLLNDELTIVAEIEVIGTIDEVASEPLKKIEQDNDGAASKDLRKKTLLEKESVDINGFQVLPSQVESVRRIFEWHPDIAVEFRGKNKDLRTACMNFLLSLMGMLHQPLKELSNEDLAEADIALTYLKNAGFKVDWLETKVEMVKEKMETEKAQASVKT